VDLTLHWLCCEAKATEQEKKLFIFKYSFQNETKLLTSCLFSNITNKAAESVSNKQAHFCEKIFFFEYTMSLNWLKTLIAFTDLDLQHQYRYWWMIHHHIFSLHLFKKKLYSENMFSLELSRMGVCFIHSCLKMIHHSFMPKKDPSFIISSTTISFQRFSQEKNVEKNNSITDLIELIKIIVIGLTILKCQWKLSFCEIN